MADAAALTPVPDDDVLVRVEDLHVRFPVDGDWLRRPRTFVHAVDGVSFTIRAGHSLALVGESGCGKSTTGKLLARLVAPSAGRILIRDADGRLTDIATARGAAMKRFRRRVQMIFQDPFESLNPRRTVYDTMAEPLVVQRIGTPAEREQRVIDLLERVGLTPAASFLLRYPHELSGGQRQRVAIGRALIVDPVFIVADEPTSMLDVSIRAGVMNLLRDLARDLGVSYLYITHDLAVARYMADTIAVMYAGKIIEQGPTEALLHAPRHPYTQALVSAVPALHAADRPPPAVIGAAVRAVNPHPRCRFFDRCPRADNVCRDHPHPPLRPRADGRLVACHHVPDDPGA